MDNEATKNQVKVIIKYIENTINKVSGEYDGGSYIAQDNALFYGCITMILLNLMAIQSDSLNLDASSYYNYEWLLLNCIFIMYEKSKILLLMTKDKALLGIFGW